MDKVGLESKLGRGDHVVALLPEVHGKPVQPMQPDRTQESIDHDSRIVVLGPEASGRLRNRFCRWNYAVNVQRIAKPSVLQKAVKEL